MKTGNRAHVWLFGGIFLLLFCVTMPASLAEKGIGLNGDNGMNKVVVTAKKTGPQTGSDLSLREVERIAGGLGTKEYTYTARPAFSRVPVKAGGAGFPSTVIGTNHRLPRFSRMEMLFGSFFTETAEREGGNVAVIDDRLAWNAFRTGNAVGETLEIYGRPFRITGVVKRDASIAGKLTDDGFPQVFIPGERLFELDSQATIPVVEVKTEEGGTMDRNRPSVSAALQEAGKNPSDYSIVDFNIKRALLEQKPDMIVFISGCVIILILAAWIRDVLKELIPALRRECRTDYLMGVIRKNAGRTGVAAGKVLTALGAMFLTAAGMRFSLFIPPALIPEELIDIPFYFELIHAGIRSGLENQGYMAGTAETLFNRLDMLTGWPLAIISAAGFLAIYAGLGKLKLLHVQIHRLALACGLFTLLCAMLLAASAGALGLPFRLETADVLIVWTFIYLNIFYCHYKSEKGS